MLLLRPFIRFFHEPEIFGKIGKSGAKLVQIEHLKNVLYFIFLSNLNGFKRIDHPLKLKQT